MASFTRPGCSKYVRFMCLSIVFLLILHTDSQPVVIYLFTFQWLVCNTGEHAGEGYPSPASMSIRELPES